MESSFGTLLFVAFIAVMGYFAYRQAKKNPNSAAARDDSYGSQWSGSDSNND